MRHCRTLALFLYVGALMHFKLNTVAHAQR